METTQIGDVVKELHRDLGRKWRTHGPRIQQFWRAFEQSRRAKALKAGQEVVLKHPTDISLGNVYKFVPEYNLRDITAPGDFLLDLLQFRATKPLDEQYFVGFNGRPGDHEHITEMMRTRNLRHIDPFKDCWTFFVEGEMYGKSFKLVKEKEESLAAFQPAIKAGICIPQAVGELVLIRQESLLQSLNILCEDILDIGSTTRSKKALPKKPAEAAAAALSKLSIKPAPEQPKADLALMLRSAQDQKESLDDVLTLLCTEPVALAHEVNIWFFSRPELVPDEKGRMLPAHTDKYISSSVFEAIHSAVRGTAIWDYLNRLLRLLENTPDKSSKTVVLQEIANLCHLEYSRTQSLLKRHLSTASAAGSKWFKRVSNTYDNGTPRVALKGKPELLIDENPQLCYMLRLSQPETTSAKAADWIRKIDEYQNVHPEASESLSDREADGFGNLAVIVNFIETLSSVMSMPSFNRKKAQHFTTKSAALESELNEIKPQLDLGDFAAPIDNLLEPGMTEATLNALDKFLVEKTGTKIGFLYQDLIDECISRLQAQLNAIAEKEEKLQQKQATTGGYIPFPVESFNEPDLRIQQRKEKEKTRPTHSSVFEILPSARSTITNDAQVPQPLQVFKVKDSTFKVFDTLLSTSRTRGSVSWINFEAAMGDLGFSILPKFGSVYTFLPPQGMASQRPLTIHRPHNSHIEGYKLLSYSRRLKRVYGWTVENFELE